MSTGELIDGHSSNSHSFSNLQSLPVSEFEVSERGYPNTYINTRGDRSNAHSHVLPVITVGGHHATTLRRT